MTGLSNMTADTRMTESAQSEVILANKEFYKQIASTYDHYEACAAESFYQRGLEQDLELIDSKLIHDARPVRCLDCGGGTGNLTLKMLKLGWDVTVVDVSSDMLEILQSKVRSARYQAEFINDSIEAYFAASQRQFDVVAFSSVLHHLYSPLDAVKQAAQRIRSGGFFYSVFDPVPPSSTFAAACFGSFDTVLAKLIHDRKDFFPGVARRLRKLTAATDVIHGRPVVSSGDLAEYHARTGIDDRLIARTLQENSFSVETTHYPLGRTGLMRWVNAYLRTLLSFKILAQRAREPRNLISSP